MRCVAKRLRAQLDTVRFDRSLGHVVSRALRAACDAEPRVDGVRDLMAAMRQAIGPGERWRIVSVDADHAGGPG